VSVLELKDLTVERGHREVVRRVSLEIPAGQVTALLGPNGAGKSTLVLAVGGVLRPKAGSVLVDGDDLAGRRPERIRRAGVAIVPEGRRLLPDLTVEDNLRVASYARPRPEQQAGRDRVLDLFPQLRRRLSALARTLSGGEQQMVVLAQALISAPRYLLIDELSLGLAPVVVSRLVPVIREVADAGTGVLLIEQFAAVALSLASRAHIMEGGRIRFSGPATELRDNPALLRSAYLLRGGTAKPAPPGAASPVTRRTPLFSFIPNGPWCFLPSPRYAREHGLIAQFLAVGVGMVGGADVEDVHRVQPAGRAVAYLMPGEPAADVGKGVMASGRGGGQDAVQLVGALVQLGPVRRAQPEAAAGLGQVVQLGVVEHDDLRVRRLGPDGGQGGVELGRKLGGDEVLGRIDGAHARAG
jgi:branched-chain amino acid transport system ATP-binding protein